MVTHFVIDYIHLTCVGVTKRLPSRWKGSKMNETKCHLSAVQKCLSEQSLNIHCMFLLSLIGARTRDSTVFSFGKQQNSDNLCYMQEFLFWETFFQKNFIIIFFISLLAWDFYFLMTSKWIWVESNTCWRNLWNEQEGFTVMALSHTMCIL